MLKDLRQRLFKVMPFDETDADTLAEEIATALADETTPADFPAGIALQAETPSGAPIQVAGQDINGDTPIFSVKRGNTTITISIDASNQIVQQASDQPDATPVGGGNQRQQTQASTFPGKVTSYDGLNAYRVDVYLAGISAGPTSVTVRQLQGDPDFPHPTDGSIWAEVTRGPDGVYTMNLPTWG